MIEPDHLLAQARELLARGQGKPRQTDLRRAHSDVYYAVFHALTYASSRLLISGKRDGIRLAVRRQYGHGNLRKACRLFASGNKPADMLAALDGMPVSPELRAIAKNFIALQDMRHVADYNHVAVFVKVDAYLAVDLAADTLALIDALKPQSRLVDYAFLISLLLQR